MRIGIFSQGEINTRTVSALFYRDLVDYLNQKIEFDTYSLDTELSFLSYPLYEDKYSHLIFVLEDSESSYFSSRAAELYQNSKALKIGVFLDHNFWNYRIDNFKDDQGSTRFSEDLEAEYPKNAQSISQLLPRRWLGSVFRETNPRSLRVKFDHNITGKLYNSKPVKFKSLNRIYVGGRDLLMRRDNKFKYYNTITSGDLDKLPLHQAVDVLLGVDLCVGTPRLAGYGEDFYTQLCIKNEIPTIVSSFSPYADELPYYLTSELELDNLKLYYKQTSQHKTLANKILEVLR